MRYAREFLVLSVGGVRPFVVLCSLTVSERAPPDFAPIDEKADE
jgi:hypothetical protein